MTQHTGAWTSPFLGSDPLCKGRMMAMLLLNKLSVCEEDLMHARAELWRLCFFKCIGRRKRRGLLQKILSLLLLNTRAVHVKLFYVPG